MANAPWTERWRSGIRLGETAVVLGLWGGGLAGSDLVIAAILLLAGLLVGVVAVWADTSRSRLGKGLITGTLAVVFSVSGAVVYWRHIADAAPSAVPMASEPVSRAKPQPAPGPGTPPPAAPPTPAPQRPAGGVQRAFPGWQADRAAAPAPKPPRLVVECHDGMMPDVPVSINDRIYTYYLQNYAGGGGFAETYSLGGGVMKFHNTGEPPMSAVTCKVYYYGNDPLINIALPISTKRWKVNKKDNTLSVGAFDVQFESSAVVPRIDPGKDNPFVFYMANMSEYYSEISFGRAAGAVDVVTEAQENIDLISTRPMLMFWPQPTYGK